MSAGRTDPPTGASALSRRIEWISHPEHFAAVADEWDRLAERAGTPFLMHAWVTAWWNAFGAERSLRVCVVWEGPRIIGALPLLAGRRAAMAGVANSHSPSFGALACDEDSLGAVLDAVCAQAGEIVLPLLPRDGDVVAAVRGSRRRFVVVEPLPPLAHVSMEGDFAAYLRASKWRKTLDRARRKLCRDHDARFALVQSPDALEAELRVGFALEASGWKGAAGTAILSSPQTERFYQDVAAAFAVRGELRTSSLTIDGQLAAWHLGILHAGRLHGLKSGYDERFRTLSPGNVTTLAIAEHCFLSGVDAYVLGPGEEDYKHRLATGECAMVTVRSYPRGLSMAGRYAYRRAVRPQLRRLARRLRHGRSLGRRRDPAGVRRAGAAG